MNSATLELLRAAQEGDRDACEQAVIENNGLSWSVVRRYYGRGVDPDDLYQLGCLGFLKAVNGFDFSYGTCFSTYAVPKIAGEIRRFLRDDGSIKVSRSIREQGQTLYTARERLRHELGREPTLSELTEITGFAVEEIAQIELVGKAPLPVTHILYFIIAQVIFTRSGIGFLLVGDGVVHLFYISLEIEEILKRIIA